MVPATKTFLPPLDEYHRILTQVWDSGWITNRGNQVLLLEKKLKDLLQVNHILITNNGTIPIQIAIQLLCNEGEIITTPYSYVATTSAIVWQHCTPVFVDIHPEYLTIDESKIEAAITSKTKAILATHIFGNCCNIEAIEQIAKKHQLRVIYDAAHSFGISYKSQSVFNYGDISTCSFHATKLFHTGEGGAGFCNDPELIHSFYYSHNFGHDGYEKYHGLGINGKISEMQAALGLSVLPYMDFIYTERKKVIEYYKSHLDYSKIRCIKPREHQTESLAYFPIIFESERALLKAVEKLNLINIYPRRNFFPALHTLNYVTRSDMPIAERTAPCVLCIPLYVGLKEEELFQICNTINKS